MPNATKEHNLNFGLTSAKSAPNNLAFYVTGPYGMALLFFAIPLSDASRYQHDVKLNLHQHQ